MRSLSIRLDERLGKKFDQVCKSAGYKKNTLVTRLIQAYVRHYSGTESDSSQGKNDPFLKVIGIAHSSFLLSPTDPSIDEIVYNL